MAGSPRTLDTAGPGREPLSCPCGRGASRTSGAQHALVKGPHASNDRAQGSPEDTCGPAAISGGGRGAGRRPPNGKASRVGAPGTPGSAPTDVKTVADWESVLGAGAVSSVKTDSTTNTNGSSQTRRGKECGRLHQVKGEAEEPPAPRSRLTTQERGTEGAAAAMCTVI